MPPLPPPSPPSSSPPPPSPSSPPPPSPPPFATAPETRDAFRALSDACDAQARAVAQLETRARELKARERTLHDIEMHARHLFKAERGVLGARARALARRRDAIARTTADLTQRRAALVAQPVDQQPAAALEGIDAHLANLET